MDHHQLFILIIVILVGNFAFERLLELLNTKASKTELPPEAEGIYDDMSINFSPSLSYLLVAREPNHQHVAVVVRNITE